MPDAPVVVAVDGPAASGKGTIARRLAEHLGFVASGHRPPLSRGGQAGDRRRTAIPADGAVAARAARALEPGDLAGEGLREETVTQAASVVAADPGVRAALLDFQRAFAAAPPGGAPGAVLDGRDIGTAVCPDAQVKLFLDASPEVRARRRVRELRERGSNAIYAAVLRDMETRDARDRGRAVAPLAPAEDAFVIDTSTMNADEVFREALAHFDAQTTSRK